MEKNCFSVKTLFDKSFVQTCFSVFSDDLKLALVIASGAVLIELGDLACSLVFFSRTRLL